MSALTAVEIGLIILIVAWNAFFVSAEFAFVAVRRTRIDELVEEGSGAARRVRAYWAPEQWTGPADARSDIYSLGLVLMEMLTGRSPSDDGTPPDNSGVPVIVQPILSRMLAVPASGPPLSASWRTTAAA